MLVVGFFFHCAASTSLFSLSNLGIVIIHSCFAYHPTVALFCGSVPAFAYLVFWRIKVEKSHLLYAIQFVAASIALFLSSLAFRSLQLASDQSASAKIVDQVVRFLEFFIWQKNSPILFSPLFHQMFLLIVVIALLYGIGVRGVAIGTWIVATFLFSVFSKGNWDYDVINLGRVDRANVTVPVVIALMIIYLKQINFRHWSVRLFISALFLTIFSATSVLQQNECRERNWDGRIMQSIGDLMGNSRNFTVYIERDLPSWWFDQFSYYFPLSKQDLLNDDCTFQLSDTASRPLLFLISTKGKCSNLEVPYVERTTTTLKMSETELLLIAPTTSNQG